MRTLSDWKIFRIPKLENSKVGTPKTLKKCAVFFPPQAGRVYMVSKGQLRQAQKQYNHLDNEWEVVLDSSSTVEECSDDGTIKSQSLKLRPIASIEREEVNSILDIIGVVTSVAPVSTISRKNGTETQKRTCFLRDNSNCQVELTLWGAFCTKEGQKLQVSGISSFLEIFLFFLFKFHVIFFC